MKIKKRTYDFRRSGRTFRMLRTVYATAVAGRSDIIIIASVAHYKRMLIDISQLDINNYNQLSRVDHYACHFKNGSSIQVGDVGLYKQGRYAQYKVFIDHHIIETDPDFMFVINQCLKWNDVDKFKSFTLNGKAKTVVNFKRR